MLKLRFSKPSTRQYMDGKVTVCKYVCTIIDGSTKEVKEKFTVTGSAKCSPNDAVNADFGRKLADSRAKFNAYKHAASFICPMCLEELIKVTDENINLLEFIDTMHYLKKKEIVHIKTICTEAE